MSSDEREYVIDMLERSYLQRLKKRLQVESSKITTEYGDSVTFEGFQKRISEVETYFHASRRHAFQVLDDPLWLLFPEKYEVECSNSDCKKMILLADNFLEDGVSVECRHCPCSTILGAPKEGFEWLSIYPCHHYQQVKKGEKPERCLVCGGETPYVDDFGDGIGTPRRKQDEQNSTNTC